MSLEAANGCCDRIGSDSGEIVETLKGPVMAAC